MILQRDVNSVEGYSIQRGCENISHPNALSNVILLLSHGEEDSVSSPLHVGGLMIHLPAVEHREAVLISKTRS